MRTGRVLLLAFIALTQASARDFTLTLLHINDTHGRVEPTILQGKPYGGMARLGTLFDKYRASDPNPIVLHAGDVFQGTIYFTVYEGMADLALLNAMGVEAMAVGNHEFDRGPAALARFIEKAKFPVLSANIDASREPLLAGRIAASKVLTRGKEKIGVVGASPSNLLAISNAGGTIAMRELRAALQSEIDKLTRAKVNKIVLLTHIGYGVDQQLARELRGVDVIVGGHTHSVLGDVAPVGFPKPEGPYPTVVANPDGGKTLIVHVVDGGRLFGRLQVTFDGKGRVKSWAGKPIVVDETVPEKPALQALVKQFQEPLAAKRDEVLATAAEAIPRWPELGEIIADAMREAPSGDVPHFAMVNPGAMRLGLDEGPITYGEVIAAFPYNNTLVELELTGAEVVSALDEALLPLWVSASVRYTYDGSKPPGSRVSGVTIAGKPIEAGAVYRVVVNNFMAGGGDQLVTLKNATRFRYDTGVVDFDALVEYLKEYSPVRRGADRRVHIVAPPKSDR